MFFILPPAGKAAGTHSFPWYNHKPMSRMICSLLDSINMLFLLPQLSEVILWDGFYNIFVFNRGNMIGLSTDFCGLLVSLKQLKAASHNKFSWSCVNVSCLFISRLPWLHQWIFAELHGLLSNFSKLTSWHIITVSLQTEPYLFWPVILEHRPVLPTCLFPTHVFFITLVSIFSGMRLCLIRWF